MPPSYLLRGIYVSGFGSAVLAPLFYIAMCITSGSAIDISTAGVLVLAGAAFGGAVALVNEIVPVIFVMRLYYCFPAYLLLCVFTYVQISNGLGAPLFSNSMGEGVFGCLSFALFTGALIRASMHEQSAYPTYLFCGMIAGFTVHPLLAALGMVASADLKYALIGAIYGAGVGFIQNFTIETSEKRFMQKWRSR